MIKLMKMVCLLIIILLLCFIIFNTRKAGFNQVSNTSNSKEHFYKDVICDLKNLTLNNESIIDLTDLTNYDLTNCNRLLLNTFENLTTIGTSAFYNKTNLTEISLPTSITKIGVGAFFGCDIKPTLDLSNTNLTTIDNSAFRENKKLTEISLPISIETIGNSAFFECDIQKLDLSNTNLTTIGAQAFNNNKKLTKIILPNSITTIGDAAFYNCDIKELDLSTNTELTTIRDGAFNNNKELTKIILPKSITTIGQAAFMGCQRIQSIIIKEIVEGNQCPSNNDNESKAGKLKKQILASLDEIVKKNIECTV